MNSIKRLKGQRFLRHLKRVTKPSETNYEYVHQANKRCNNIIIAVAVILFSLA
jgi:hypothetical protein